jgi:hypothetical protein
LESPPPSELPIDYVLTLTAVDVFDGKPTPWYCHVGFEVANAVAGGSWPVATWTIKGRPTFSEP